MKIRYTLIVKERVCFSVGAITYGRLNRGINRYDKNRELIQKFLTNFIASLFNKGSFIYLQHLCDYLKVTF